MPVQLCHAGGLALFSVVLAWFRGAGAAVDQAVHPRGAESAMVHLFEWSWGDIAKECEVWLGPKGFTAVQVSPPTDHVNHTAWWARYQPVTLKLLSRSGDEAAFADMVKRCAQVGVGIYVDAVINHAAAGAGVSIAGSNYSDRSTPQWKPSDFHHSPHNMHANCVISNYNDKLNVQRCDLLGLPDLCSGCANVRKHQADYMTRLAELGVSGFRIDAAKHIDVVELGELIRSAAPGRNVFWYQEVYAPARGEAVTSTMYTQNGALEYFDYSQQVTKNFIPEGKLKYFNTFGEAWGMLPSEKMVVFLDNHDTQRNEARLTYKGSSLYELASIFMLAHPYGYPKIMSSFYFSNFDQGPPHVPVHGASGHLACGSSSAQVEMPIGKPWVCEHRWTSLANMVGWRRSAGTNAVGSFWGSPDGNRMFMCRGQDACIAFNRDERHWWRSRQRLSMPPGRYCNIIKSDVVYSCEKITVDEHGFAALEVPPLSAVALHIGVEYQTTTSTTRAPCDLLETSSSTTSTASNSAVARSGSSGNSSHPAVSKAHSPRLRGIPGQSIEVEATAGLPPAAATSIRACVAGASNSGGDCRWGILGSSQLCYIRSKMECCQAAGVGIAACCEMAKAMTVPYEYRKLAGIERCFTAAPGAKKCAKRTENCASTGCCEDAGHTCYEKDRLWSGCLRKCTPGMEDPFGRHGRWNCHRADISASEQAVPLHF